MKLYKPQIIIYPIVLTIFSPIVIYFRNFQLIKFYEVLSIIIILQIAMVGLWWFTNRMTSHRKKSALIISIFFILFFSFGHILPAFGHFLIRIIGVDLQILLFGNFEVSLYILLFICIGLMIFLIYLIRRISSDFHLVTLFMNISSLILIFLMMIQLTNSYLYTKFVLNEFVQTKALNSNSLSLKSNDLPTIEREKLPNILYIILDAYGRDDILMEYYNFDNTGFINQLSDRGFYIASNSNSNYPFTLFSLSSSLNMFYLGEFQSIMGAGSNNLSPILNLIQSNEVLNLLTAMGYETVAFETGHYGTNLNNVDLFSSPPLSLKPYSNDLINITPTRIWLRDIQLKSHSNRILYTLEELPSVVSTDKPFFVFAYIGAPRQPFVFGADGEVNTFEKQYYSIDIDNLPFVSNQSVYIQGYRDQVNYLNDLLIKTIDQILERYGRNSIIIIQGDHGPRSMIDWSNIENSNVQERMGILNGYYFPDHDYSRLYPEITPVNTFRVVFDQFLFSDFGLLEDRSYFSLYETPYEFIDVTDEIHPSTPSN